MVSLLLLLLLETTLLKTLKCYISMFFSCINKGEIKYLCSSGRFTGQLTASDPLQTLFHLLTGRVPAAALVTHTAWTLPPSQRSLLLLYDLETSVCNYCVFLARYIYKLIKDLVNFEKETKTSEINVFDFWDITNISPFLKLIKAPILHAFVFPVIYCLVSVSLNFSDIK